VKSRPANLAASVHQRLLNQARATGRPFNELLQYFAMERFLYRLSKSPRGGSFVLKGGLLLALWRVSVTRATKDIDLLGHVPNDVDGVVVLMRDACSQAVEPDGVEFDPASVAGERIAEEAEYEGVRVRFRGRLGNARLSLQVDVGFGDAVVPGPVEAEYPTILDLPPPLVRAYTRENVVAEKFHTMFRRGLLNSRLRDYFDVWALSRQFDFEGPLLSRAVTETFARRQAEVPSASPSLTDEFAADPARKAQWRGFLRRSRLEGVPQHLREVVQGVAAFLGPVAVALHEGVEFPRRWRAPGPWSPA
jgi:predicted nucleotidyltransferase component of viral defense system